MKQLSPSYHISFMMTTDKPAMITLSGGKARTEGEQQPLWQIQRIRLVGMSALI
jgi:hypothetical protein